MSRTHTWYSICSLTLAFIMTVFTLSEAALGYISLPPFFHYTYLYFFLLILSIALCARIYLQEPTWQKRINMALITSLPTVLIFYAGYTLTDHLPLLFKVFFTLYLFFFSFWFLYQYFIIKIPSQEPQTTTPFRKTIWIVVFFLNSIFFLFGLHNLGAFAAVDEPLWLYGRIPRYFKNIAEGELPKTAVSDKPGITVSLISGTGLIFIPDPSLYEKKKYQGEFFGTHNDHQVFFKTFRAPILVFLFLALFLFFYLNQRLLGTTGALLTQALLATSPILIGMGKIINPDSLLWMFSSLSLLSFFVYRKEKSLLFLYLASFLFGLALLTKYVANILLLFFFLFFIVEVIYRTPQKEAWLLFCKERLAEIVILFLGAVLTFYLLLPAMWVEPRLLLEATLFSQAFEQFAYIFLILVGLLLLEIFANQGRVSKKILPLLPAIRTPLTGTIIFLLSGSFLYLLIHVWLPLSHYEFSTLLSSPKTISGATGFIGILLSNFYVMFFSQHPLVLLGFFLCLTFLWIERKQIQTSQPMLLALFLLFAILLYHLGSVLTGVASIVRYQIIVYPLVILVAGIGYLFLMHAIVATNKNLILKTLLALFIISGIWTLTKTPFPLSYASLLLPKEEVLDVKDMGAGSFEAATYLNNLPHAEKLTIWTDKSGVCVFFVGRCLSSPGKKTLADPLVDYVVLSSTRKERITNMTTNRVAENPNLIPLPSLYTHNNAVYTLAINGRPNHFVKIFSYTSPLREQAEKDELLFENHYFENLPRDEEETE